MPQLLLPQAEIYYETLGAESDGPWVTLINGHMRSHKDFRAFSKHLVMAGFRVLVYDNRGVGNTRYQGAFALDDLANDALELWDHLQIEQSHLLGISMGGVVSQIIASQVPEQVCSLILVSTTAYGKWLAQANGKPWSDDPKAIEDKLNLYFTEDFREKNRLLVQAMAKQMAKELKSEFYQQGAKDQRSAMQDLDIRHLTKQIRAKTLILHGQEDYIIAAGSAEELAELIPNAELHVISSVGHLLLAEYAKPMYQQCIEFLQRNSKTV